MSPLELMQTPTIHKTLWKGALATWLHNPWTSSSYFIWHALFLLLEVWVFNYSLLLEASKIFFTRFLICLFSELKSHGLHHIEAILYLPLFPLSFSEVLLVLLDPFQDGKCEQTSAQNSSYRHTISIYSGIVMFHVIFLCLS